MVAEYPWDVEVFWFAAKIVDVAWSQLFNAAIAANCRWRMRVGFHEYTEGGKTMCHTQLVTKLRPRSKRHFHWSFQVPWLFWLTTQIGRLATSPGRPWFNFKSYVYWVGQKVNTFIAGWMCSDDNFYICLVLFITLCLTLTYVAKKWIFRKKRQNFPRMMSLSSSLVGIETSCSETGN
jgi:hypothetical protein